MMSSTGSELEETHHQNSSSWSSSSSPFPNTNPRISITTRTMEEVWKDINLASLSNSNNTPNFRHMTLQDFLATPFANVVPPTPDHHRRRHVTLNSPPPPHPVLNLNHPDQLQLFCIDNLNSTTSRPFVNLNQTNYNTNTNTNSNSNVSAENSFSGAYPFEGIASHSSPSSGLVMPPGFDLGRNQHGGFGGGGGGDQRFKRMIKNRESAARSRARKQAYTCEMEITVKHLMKENARLRRLNEQLTNAAAAATQLRKKHTLNRSSSAPF